MSGASIEALLTLDASSFFSNIESAETSVKTFVAQVKASESQVKAFGTAIGVIGEELLNASSDITRFNKEAKGMEQFNRFTNGVKALAQAIQILGSDASTSAVGVQRVINIIREMEGAFSGGTIKVQGLASALRELRMQEEGTGASTQKMDSELKQAKQDLMNLGNAVQPMARVREQADMMKAEFQRARQELMNFARYGVQSFNEMDASSDRLKAQMESMNAEFERSKAELLEFARYGRSQFGTITAGVQQYERALEVALPTQRQMITNNIELANAERQKSSADRESASSSQQVASAEEKQSVATDRATNSMNKQTSASKGLGKALSSLKMMGTMVGSMIAYNFVHNLAMATTETINAKSEMNGYFQMLGYSTRQVDEFNKALDVTVKKFPRLNKYALGETISSIGVEFELTTAEMKKAMPVVSMITSEYLRAGRNVNEASLAVKDILQGEFQRLSRETGVKGDQLKATGLWSGDKSDVMGLLKALEKVGKDRNWDTFVQKANSLNDAVLITQNRFSEWSADMVERVQPAILSVFNNLMIVGNDFAKAFNKVLDWLSGDGIGQGIVKWGGLATAITTVTLALIAYRTGANLTQIAQMGLTRSIGASILGLEAEKVAEHGVINTILLKNEAITVETLKNEGRLNSIIGVVTGLQAEEVAEIGRLKALMGSVLGLDMATLKQYGFRTALLSSITGVDAETIALDGLNARMMGTIALTGAVAGALIVLTGVLVAQAIQISETTEKYAKFVKMVDKGDEIISEAKDTVDDLTSKKERLAEKLDTLEKGTYAYNVVANQLAVTTDDLRVATEGYSDAVNSVAWAKHKQELYDEEKASAQATAQRQINQALLDYGMNVQEASQLSNQYWNDAINGWNQHYETLQKVNLQYSKNATSVQNALNELENTKLTDKEVTVLIRRKITAGNEIADAKEELGNATSLTEYLDKWLWLQVKQIKNAFVDWDIHNDHGGLTEAIGGAVWGIVHFFGDNFIGQFTQALAKDWGLEGVGTRFVDKIKEEGLGAITDALYDFFHMDTFASDLEQFKQGFQDMFKDLDFDFIGMLMDAILPAPASASDGTSDHPSFMEDVSAILGFDVQSWVDSFSSDPLGTLGIVLPTVTIDSISQWVYSSFVKPIGDGLFNGIKQIPIVGDIVSLFGLVTDENVSASNKGKSIAHWIGNGINTAIGEIPIVGDILRMLGLIPSTNSDARNKGYGVGQNIKQGEQDGHKGMADSIRTEMGNVVTAISNAGANAYAVAHDVGSKILNGIKDAMDMHSPSIISRELIANEFGIYIPQAITDNSDIAYNSAYSYAEKIKEGISNAGTTTIGMDTMVDDYETDAQTIALSSKMMGNDTTSAFNQMQMSVNATTNQMQTNVVGTYSQIQSKQASSLNTMKTQNISAYNDMYLKSNQSMMQMRDSTTNITHQMTNAWNLMKNNIVASAQKIKTDSEIRFNSLSTTIGGFYRKIQNPSQWGGGAGHGTSTRVARKPSVGKALVRGVKSRGGYAGGLNTKPNNATMTISQLKRQLCPSGDCANLFDGYNMNDTVNVWDFLQSIGGEHGLGGWNFSQSHYNYIKNKSDAWDTAPPIIDLVGGIPTSNGFKVNEFNDGTPKISFSTFEQIATSIFSTIPYKFYFDSSWKGSWLGALQSGACNCYDGALALIALANTFGFSGSMAHGSWTDPSGKKTAHVWAVINGVKMDTTGMQQRGSWRPSASAGGNPNPSANSKTVNITVDMSGATVYGVEDLDNRIQESVAKGLQAEFNDPYTVSI